MIPQETSDNVQGFGSLATRMKNLQPIFSKVKEMEIEGTGVVVDFLEKLEVCVPRDIH
ncbi:hypothetical protein L208DRAFT_1419789 [Tricholoma matsutake]|nr:hypothetical protein L208DRAFT_1419789 [Tricholoma matsutake 945]